MSITSPSDYEEESIKRSSDCTARPVQTNSENESIRSDSPAETDSVAAQSHELMNNNSERNARAAQKQAHLQTICMDLKRYPKTIGWICLMLWILILFGFESRAGGQIFSIPQFRQNFGIPYKNDYVIPASWHSATQAGPIAMNVVGLYVGSFLADHLGKKWVLFGSLLLSIGAIGIEYAAEVIEVYFGGKMVNGFAQGIMSALCIAYVAEISPLSIRGVATSFTNLSLSVGPVICSILGLVAGTWQNYWSYRSILVAQWGIAAIALAIQPFMPESPGFYLRKGKEEAAKKSVDRLCSNEEDSENQLNILKITLAEAQELSHNNNASYIECFRGSNRRRTLLACLVFFTHPMSGMPFISSYGPYIYQLTGIGAKASFRMSLIAQCLSILGTIISFFIIDRFGRRPLILSGMTSIMAVLFSIGITGTKSTKSYSAQLACVAFLMIFSFFYNGGIGAIAYTIASEIPTSVMRTKTVAISLSVNHGFGTMWAVILPFIINPDEGDLGAKVAFLFFGFTLVNLMLLYIFLPETADRTYEELDELFKEGVTVKKFRNHLTVAQLKSDKAYKEKFSSEVEPLTGKCEVENIEHV